MFTKSINITLVIQMLLISAFSEAKETPSKKRLEYVVVEYSKHYKTVSDVIESMSKIDSAKAEELKIYLNSKKIKSETLMPRLTTEGIYLVFVDKKEMKMNLAADSIEISVDGKKEKISLSAPVARTIQSLEKLLIPAPQTSLLQIIIPEAHANDLTEAVGIYASGLYVSAAFGVLSAMDTVDRIYKDIKSIPGDMMEKHTRNEANKACEDIQNNKPVKNVEKIKTKLEALKKKVDCVPYWESFMENSCGWFDERIQCLSQGSVEVSDKSRGQVKDAPADSSKNDSIKSSGVSK